MIFKKILKFLTFLLFYFLSPILFLFIKLLKPFKTIRITPLLSNRYGHLVLNPEFYILEKLNNEHNDCLDLFYTVRYGVCNNVVLKMWKRKIKIFPHYILEPLHKISDKFAKNKNIHTINFFNSKIRDTFGNFEKYPPSIFLDESQKKKCIEILNKFNIDFQNKKFVCLFNRDDAYLNSGIYKKNWYYLSHHNYKINTFEKAARKLSSNNIMVFRMGAKVEDEFNLNDPNIIDYANSDFQSELMDVFLASSCFFGISCGTGSSHVALLNRKPIVDLNANVHHLFTFLENSILLSKHYFSKEKKRYLNLKEILSFKEHQMRKREQLDKLGIDMIDCTQEEISEAVEEMVLRLNGKWTDDEEMIKLQNKFKRHNWQNIYRIFGDKKVEYHGEVKARYSSKYLLNNSSWLN